MSKNSSSAERQALRQALGENERLRQEIARLKAQLEAPPGSADDERDDQHALIVRNLSRSALIRKVERLGQYDKKISDWQVLTMLEVMVIMLQIWVKAHATDLRGEPLIVALELLKPELQKSWDNLCDLASQQNKDAYQIAPNRAEIFAAMMTGIARAIPSADNPTPDDGAMLRSIPLSDEKFTPDIIAAIEKQRKEQEEAKQAAEEQARQEAIEAENKRKITDRTIERQRLKDLAIEELKTARTERPAWSKPKVRDHYVTKCEALISVDRFPPEKMETFEYIRQAAESTLYTWDF